MRPRFQTGSVSRIGGKWTGRYRDAEGRRRAVILDAKNKTAAQAKLAEILAPINAERMATTAGPKMPLGLFVEHVYLPFAKRKWKASTAITTEQRLRQHIISGELRSASLADISREVLQRFLDARQLLSFSIVNHLRWDLRAICRMAVEDGHIKRDPTGSLFTPDSVTAPEKRIMTKEDITAALNALQLRERLFIRFALFAGMRPGEIIALRWNSFDDALAKIESRIYKGAADRPKGRKGRATARVAALPSELLKDLARWGEFRRSNTAYVFVSANMETPEKYENIWQRTIKPAFEALKPNLGWCTFQVMRRTWSSLSKSAGAGHQAVADQLGHTVKVDQAEYSQSTLAEKLDAVERFERWVM